LGWLPLTGEGRIAQSNRALEEIIGFTPQETIGRILWDLMPAEDMAIAQEAYRDLISGKLSTNREQRRLIAKDGQVLLADVGLTPVRDDDGQTQLVLASFEDITAQSRLEVELRHSQKLESSGGWRLELPTRSIRPSNSSETTSISSRARSSNSSRCVTATGWRARKRPLAPCPPKTSRG